MASVAASLRRGCFSSAITPDATIGTAGMSHRIRVIAEARELRSECSRFLHQAAHPFILFILSSSVVLAWR